MKSIKTIVILSVIFLIYYLISCAKDDNENNEKSLILSKTEKGGCFVNTPDYRKSAKADTVFFKVTRDSLSMNLGLNYNCCSRLADSIDIKNDVITAFIKDTCTNLCVCRCVCYFTFDFKFVGYTPKTLIYIIKLKRHNESIYNTIMQDTIQY
ncbi:MAG: hypothetical protein MUC93_06590 [Bacteroidales bacterium]|jgi:hypothetical protein|nr:hypothetical protein [Bacteroidales bacterium]